MSAVWPSIGPVSCPVLIWKHAPQAHHHVLKHHSTLRAESSEESPRRPESRSSDDGAPNDQEQSPAGVNVVKPPTDRNGEIFEQNTQHRDRPDDASEQSKQLPSAESQASTQLEGMDAGRRTKPSETPIVLEVGFLSNQSRVIDVHAGKHVEVSKSPLGASEREVGFA